MIELTDLTAAQTTALIATWQLALRAEDKSPATIKVYTQGVSTYLTWCTARGAAPMTRTSLNTWTAEMLDAGAADGTRPDPPARDAPIHRLAHRRGPAPRRPLPRHQGTPQRQPLVTPLTDDELRALISTCTAPTHRPHEPLHHRRDEAIIRLMLETGIRAGELIALGADDFDLVADLVSIRPRQRRPRPGHPDRTSSHQRAALLPRAAGTPPPRRLRRSLAGGAWSPLRLRRPRPCAAPSRPARWHRRLPPAQAPPHRRPPVAHSRRL